MDDFGGHSGSSSRRLLGRLDHGIIVVLRLVAPSHFLNFIVDYLIIMLIIVIVYCYCFIVVDIFIYLSNSCSISANSGPVY